MDQWDRLDRLSLKVDSMSEKMEDNHLQVLRAIEVMRTESSEYRIAQMEKFHELDKRVDKHEGLITASSKLLFGGGIASIGGLILYIKDLFKH